MLKEARNFLQDEFEKNYFIVKDNPYFATFAKEKIHHSLQVLGAGNYILRHEPWFADKNDNFIELAGTAILLHDIARFDEIREKYRKPQDFDHGVAGAKKLRQILLYDDIRITLPIKHHGHLIEEFYADVEYQNIDDDNLKEEVTNIIFAIRDADKIANFNLITHDLEILEALFVPKPEKLKTNSRQISEDVLGNFYAHKTLDREKFKTQADYMLSYIAWIFDINYKSSLMFCRKLNIVHKLFKHMMFYHDNKELNDKLEWEMDKYIKHRFGI